MEEDGWEGLAEPDRTLTGAWTWNRDWSRVLRQGGLFEPRVRRVAGCSTRGDWWDHVPRADRPVGRSNAPCPARAKEGGADVRMVRPYYCGDTRLCAICAEKYQKKAGRRVQRVFRAASVAATDRGMKDVRALGFEFTLPRELQPLAAPWERHKDFLDACLGAIEDTYRAIHPGLRQIGATANVHLVSSSQPWKKKPHVHVDMVNVAAFGDKRNPEWRQVRYHLLTHHLVRLKDAFRARFEAAFGVTWTGPVNVHVQHYPIAEPSTGRLLRKAAHRLAYDFRSFTLDVRKGLAVTDYSAQKVLWHYYDKKNDESVRELVDLREFVEGVVGNLERPSHYTRVRWFGWMGNQVLRRNLALLGVQDIERVLDDDAPEADDDDGESLGELSLGSCPLCGGGVYLRDRAITVTAAPGTRLFLEGISTVREVIQAPDPPPDEATPGEGIGAPG